MKKIVAKAPALPQVHEKYNKLTRALIAANATITTMESCTSGLIASLITDTEGSSAILKGACITYSNEAKVMEGVPAEIIETYGVYSLETAAAMAAACRTKYQAQIGIGVTGSLGNCDPANADSVPGEVYLCCETAEDKVTCFLQLEQISERFEAKLAIADTICDIVITTGRLDTTESEDIL